MTKEGMRLVAMIEEKNGKYDVINFLPDVQLEHIHDKNFKVIEKEDYVKVLYSQGIEDVTVIVGENGVGKTRLMRSLSKPQFYESGKKIYLIFKQNTNWIHLRLVPEGERISSKGYQVFNLFNSEGEELEFDSPFANSNHSKVDTILISNSLELNYDDNGISDKVFGQDKSTISLINERGIDYQSFIRQDATNQILFLIRTNEKGESFKSRLSDMVDFSTKSIRLGIDKGRVDRDRNYRESIEDNLAYRWGVYNYGYNVLESADEFIDERINESLLKEIGIDDKEIEKIKEQFCNYYKINIEAIKDAIGERVSKYLDDENNSFSYLDLLQYKDDLEELQSTIINAYRQCFISILALSDKRKNSNQRDVQELCQVLKANPKIPFSINKIVSGIDNSKNSNLRGNPESYAEILSKFYAYSIMEDSELFENLKNNLDLDDKYMKDFQVWLEIFDDVFNFSGEQENALFNIETENFKEFISNLIADENTILYHRELLMNFIKFLNSPIPEGNYHFRLLKQLREYWSLDWKGLSSGEYSLLNQFGRLNSVEKEGTKGSLVILFDEVDLGLHPEWQRRWLNIALPIISEIFKDKRVQIIMTTHSPIMLSDIYSENVIMLKKDQETGDRIVQYGYEEKKLTFGQNIHDLFTDSFFLESTKGEYSTKVMNALIQSLYRLSNWDDKDNYIRERFIKLWKKEFKTEFDKNDKGQNASKKREFEQEFQNKLRDGAFLEKSEQRDKFEDERQINIKNELRDFLEKNYISTSERDIDDSCAAIYYKKIIDNIGEELIRKKLLALFDSLSIFKPKEEVGTKLIKEFSALSEEDKHRALKLLADEKIGNDK
ncbi:hypothetical protein AB6M99_01715 [Streptococcus hillyeri]|uniref:AAA family ATPase n=1 Tax=Streptococcus hillyeri TaxID=2282420 RepID=UPI0034E1972D